MKKKVLVTLVAVASLFSTNAQNILIANKNIQYLKNGVPSTDAIGAYIANINDIEIDDEFTHLINNSNSTPENDNELNIDVDLIDI